MRNERPVMLALALILAGCGDTPQSDPIDGPDTTIHQVDTDVSAETDAVDDSGMATDTDDASETVEADTVMPFVPDPRDPIEVIATVDPATLPGPSALAGNTADLLVSEATTECLVVQGEVVEGATVTVGTCRSHRWFVDGQGIHPESSPGLCLDAAADWVSPIVLTPCESLTRTFTLGASGGIQRGELSIDLTAGGQLITYGSHGGINQRWRLYRDVVALLEASDRAIAYPFAFDDAEAYALEQARARVNAAQPPYPGTPHASVADYPGAVALDAPMVSHRVHLDRDFDHAVDYLRVAWPAQHWQSTGLYAPPGQLIVVDVPAETAAGLYLRINLHTDVLEPTSGNVEGGTFQRPPQVALRVALEPGLNHIRSAYGGTVVVQSTADLPTVVPLDIHGAVAMPRYVLGVTTEADWLSRRALGTPWAELEGDRAVITVPSSQVRDLADPARVAALYDKVVTLEMALFGLDGDGVHRPYEGKIRLVEDRQISAGWGHSGFPIMATVGWELADLGSTGDDWGVWHEMGHNHQQFCLWSSRFGSESTVNLFSLYVQESLGQPSRIAADYAPTVEAVANGLTFDEADVWQKLVFLMQPVLAFDDRWDIYRRVNKVYREFSAADASAICASTAAQTGTFYVVLSQSSGHDLRNHFAAWGLPIEASYLDEVAALNLPVPATPVAQTAL